MIEVRDMTVTSTGGQWQNATGKMFEGPYEVTTSTVVTLTSTRAYDDMDEDEEAKALRHMSIRALDWDDEK